ncbi:MAG TPA: hypothetical protein VGN64_07485 [Dyadobacter sp.]|nr:hypothetical protein [Dyadobacter sp.]
MKQIFVLLLTFVCLQSFAQNTASVTIATPAKFEAQVTLILEDVHFHPNLGIGLSDTKLETIASVNLMEKQSEKVSVQISEPKMMRLQFSGGGVNKTRMLFIQPGDDLTATFPGNSEATFTGNTAIYQTFLQKHFLENQYQYLPVFGYRPAQIENKAVALQSDSLKQARLTAYQQFKSTNPNAAPAFEAYVNATTQTESSVIRRLIQEKIMRRNRVSRLEPAQQKELEDLTLAEFKVLPDDALLSQSYREELRNWISIPALRKFPLSASSNYEISADALKEIYADSKSKLQANPKQQAYLLTYWLNYAATALPNTDVAKTLLADYKSTLPQSEYTEYISKLITTKETLKAGAMAPEFTLLNGDSTAVSLNQLKGKPVCLVFAFSIGQHEPALKALEEKYKGKVTFVYTLMTSGIPLHTWKPYATERADTKHLWASEENIDLLKEKYAVDIRYPFAVIDANGKIVDRWIPQEFPNNKTLEATIQKALQ